MITHKQFMKALKARTEADLLISQYNLQEAKKLVEHIKEIKTDPVHGKVVVFDDETFLGFDEYFNKLTTK